MLKLDVFDGPTECHWWLSETAQMYR